jgi:pSer/pThr/pTyr-binding forkhead associated (FHA) protein
MDARFKILSGPHSGETVPVPRGKFLIGREVDCHLRSDSGSVSRHHCVLLLDEYTLRIRDLGSKNGTYVNGRRIGTGELILLHGDIVSVASLNEMTFEIQLGSGPIGMQPAAPEARPSDCPAALEGTGVFDGETAMGDSAGGRPPGAVPETFRVDVPRPLPLSQQDGRRIP